MPTNFPATDILERRLQGIAADYPHILHPEDVPGLLAAYNPSNVKEQVKARLADIFTRSAKEKLGELGNYAGLITETANDARRVEDQISQSGELEVPVTDAIAEVDAEVTAAKLDEDALTTELKRLVAGSDADQVQNILNSLKNQPPSASSTNAQTA